MKTILIPTDFSDNAGDALDYALQFIGSQRAKIHILHVITPQMAQVDVAVYTTDLLQEFIDSAGEQMLVLEMTAKAYLQENKDAHFSLSTNVAVGQVAQAIKTEAEEVEADLVIMGTQGINHNSLERRIGTVSTSVLRNAPCPVLLVPRTYRFTGINHLLFATSLNHGDPYELWRAVKLLQPHVDVVRCLHVTENEIDKDSKSLQTFADFLVRQSPALQTFFDVEVSTNVNLSLVEYAEAYGSEMIVMHRSKRNLWERLFESSHTKQMVSWLDIPLLVMDNQE